MKTIITLLSVCTILISFGQNVSLDSNYVINGINKLEIANGSDDQCLLSAIQPDNKVLICGATYSPSLNNTYPYVSRYLPNGDLDSSFNFTGINIVNSLATCFPYSMALQDDGKIILAGQYYKLGKLRGIVIRFNENGSIDSTFNQTGITDVSYPFKNLFGRFVAMQGDKIILAGYIEKSSSNQDFFAARFLTNGMVDSSFATNGLMEKDFGGLDVCRGVTVQNDNKIILTGYEENSLSANVVRLLENGSEDTAFGAELASNTQYLHAAPYQSLIQQDAKILNIGFSYDTLTGKINAYVKRLLPSGAKDISFANDGEFMFNIPGEDTYGIYGAIYQSDKIVIVGNSGNAASHNMKMFAIGLNNNGSIDSTFADDGVFTGVLSSGYELLNAVGLSSSGKLIATGHFDEGGNWYKPAIVQFNVNGLVGVPVEHLADVQVFLGPNPLTGGSLNIFNHSDSKLYYDIYDAMGKIVYAGGSIEQKTKSVKRIGLNKGVYFFKFYARNKNISKTIRFIQQ